MIMLQSIKRNLHKVAAGLYGSNGRATKVFHVVLHISAWIIGYVTLICLFVNLFAALVVCIPPRNVQGLITVIYPIAAISFGFFVYFFSTACYFIIKLLRLDSRYLFNQYRLSPLLISFGLLGPLLGLSGILIGLYYMDTKPTLTIELVMVLVFTCQVLWPVLLCQLGMVISPKQAATFKIIGQGLIAAGFLASLILFFTGLYPFLIKWYPR